MAHTDAVTGSQAASDSNNLFKNFYQSWSPEKIFLSKDTVIYYLLLETKHSIFKTTNYPKLTVPKYTTLKIHIV